MIDDAIILLTEPQVGQPQKGLQPVSDPASLHFPLQQLELLDGRLRLAVEQQLVGQVEAGFEDLGLAAGIHRHHGLAKVGKVLAKVRHSEVVDVGVGVRVEVFGDPGQTLRHAGGTGVGGPAFLFGERSLAGRVGEERTCHPDGGPLEESRHISPHIRPAGRRPPSSSGNARSGDERW